MVAITLAGSGATMKSPTAEGQLAEILAFIQIQENDSTKNPNARDYIKSIYDHNSGFFTSSFTLNYTVTIGTDGSTIYNVVNYLMGVTFSPGTGGTFKSTNPISYLL